MSNSNVVRTAIASVTQTSQYIGKKLRRPWKIGSRRHGRRKSPRAACAAAGPGACR